MGAWFPGERVVLRGKDLFHDLGHLGWMELLLYAITGRMFSERQVRLFQGFWTLSTSYPDPRIWNNRVAALAGTTRSTAAMAISAGNAVSDASIYGQRPIIRSIDFLIRIQKQVENGGNLEELVISELMKHRGIAGYGRPVTQRDERIEPVMALAEQVGFAEGKHVKLAFDVERILLQGRWRLHMNIAAVLAGLAADQGLTRHEYCEFMVLCFSAGMFPCYLDALNKAEGAFFPLRCSRLKYAGKGRRVWSRIEEPRGPRET